MAKLVMDNGEEMEVQWSKLPEDVKSNVMSWQKHLFDRIGGEHFILVTTRKKSEDERPQPHAKGTEEPS